MVFRSARGRENQTGGEGKRNGRGSHQGPRPPFLKNVQECGHPGCSKSTVEISLAGLARQSKSDVGTDRRAHRCHGGILVPRQAVGGNQNGDEDVGAAKSRQWRAIENSEKKEPECAQVAEYRKDGVPTIRGLEQNV